LVKIGILACENTAQITEALILILKTSNNTITIKNNYNSEDDDLLSFIYSDTDYLIIPINHKKAPKFTLDILILDNPNNKRIITYDLVNCVRENTILIYNTDNGYLPKLEHPNAIDYGFSASSTVGISSIEYSDYNTCSFIVSVQKPLNCLCGEIFPIGELLTISNSDIKIENRIPAVICSLICTRNYKNPIRI